MATPKQTPALNPGQKPSGNPSENPSGNPSGKPSGKTSGKPRPLEIRYIKDERILEVDFDDGRQFRFPAELLRVESPSAEVQGHGPSEKKIVGGKRFVGIEAIEPVGHYAIRIRFDDHHDTGIYSWETLYDYGLRQDELWQRYVQAAAEQGINRDL